MLLVPFKKFGFVVLSLLIISFLESETLPFVAVKKVVSFETIFSNRFCLVLRPAFVMFPQ